MKTIKKSLLERNTELMKNAIYTAAEFFAGGGGFGLGMIMTYFRILYAAENFQNAIDNYRKNLGNHIHNVDIAKLNAEDVLKEMNMKVGELDYAHYSPPCTKISRASGMPNPFDPLNGLYFRSIELIHKIQPKVFSMETVDNITSKEFSGLLNSILYMLKKEDLYRFDYRILNAADYNVPQNRKRFILVGVRKDLNLPPVFPIRSDKVITVKDLCPDVEAFYSTQFSKSPYSPNRPLCTLTASKSLKFIKNTKPVDPTIDELVKLSTFPEDYEFEGVLTNQWKILGNSVPPNFAEAIAMTIKEQILDVYYNNSKI